MENLSSERRYIELKNTICGKIYDGTYRNNERIPSERQLAEQFGLSRITVRRTLELLEKEGLVVREVGNGTKVTLTNRGNSAPLDVIALVTHAKSPFFSHFITEFQKCTWEHNSLLLYVEVPGNSTLEDCLYRLYSRNIRNAVVWLDDRSVDKEKIFRLRSIGMNLVFFDTDAAHPYADSVIVDNADAVHALSDAIPVQMKNVLYIGWDNLAIRNIRKREEFFRSLYPDGTVHTVSWSSVRKVSEEDLEKAARAVSALGEGAVLFGTGDIGTQLLERMERAGRIRISTEGEEKIFVLSEGKETEVQFAAVDAQEAAGVYPMLVYNQNMKETTARIYACLENQIQRGKDWEACILFIKGELVQI